LGLAVAAWPGWLQGFAGEPRRWAMEPDPSLATAASELTRWRSEGRLSPDAHGFCLSAAGADTLAWLCPAEKSFMDGRPGAFPASVTADFVTARLALVAQAPEAARVREGDWRPILDKHKVAYVILYDPSDRNMEPAFRRLLAVPEHWELVHLNGRASIFARRLMPGEAEMPVLTAAPLDLTRRAFQPPAEEKAPAAGAGRDPEARTWLDAFSRPRPLTHPDRDEALLYLNHFETQKGTAAQASLAWWENNLAASLVGVAGAEACLPAVPGATLFQLALLQASPSPPAAKTWVVRTPIDQLAFQLFSSFHDRQADQGPPGDVYLAIRAARRALREDPDDPVTHLVLGEAYLRLLRQTRERGAAAKIPLLDLVRRAQAITALKNATQLRPDLLKAHERLTALYQEVRAFDLAWHHLQEQVRLNRAAASRSGEPTERQARRLRQLEEEERKLGQGVRNARTDVEARSIDLDVVGRARLAESRGLPGKALEILLGADSGSLGRDGAQLQLRLLLLNGQLQEARDRVTPAQADDLGADAYHWHQAQVAAAEGNYAAADRNLQRLLGVGVGIPGTKVTHAPFRDVLAWVVAKYFLESTAPHVSPYQEDRRIFQAHLENLMGLWRHQADLRILRGLLALEEGDTDRAATNLREGLAFGGSDPQGGAALAHRYLRLMGKGQGQ
jgi:hypothetical protein